MKTKLLIIILILIAAGLIYYFGFYQKAKEVETLLSQTEEQTTPQNESESQSVGLANPASVYCQDQGGQLAIKTFVSGQKGFCLFADGSQCEEWDFFRGDCAKGDLKIEVSKEGTGILADTNNTITVDYTGYLTDGTKFDSSLSRGQPFSFVLGAGQVIKGWDQGILGMQVGEEAKLTIASKLAYGPTGIADVIPANATLTFDIKVLAIQ